MTNLEILEEAITEGKAQELIFDGCRTNLARRTRTVAGGFTVSFRPAVDGKTHEAALRDPAGTVVALATVDCCDC